MHKAEAIIIKEPINFKQEYIYTELIVKYGSNKIISLKADDKFRFNHNGSIHESDNIKAINGILKLTSNEELITYRVVFSITYSESFDIHEFLHAIENGDIAKVE